MANKKVDVVEDIAQVVYDRLKKHLGSDKKVIRAGIRTASGYYREMKVDVEGYQVSIIKDESFKGGFQPTGTAKLL